MKEFRQLLGNRTLCEIQADFCGVFTNPERIRIMLVLEDKEMSVSDIAQRLDISMPNLSQHLRLMKDRRCLTSRKEGKNVYYRVTSSLFMEGMFLIRRGLQDAEKQRK
ncbi:MAG: ArsR/SmtB family transcription factor [Opitutales bacterium]